MTVTNDAPETLWAILALWSGAILAFAYLAARVARRLPKGLRRVCRRDAQGGFAYSTTFMLTIPVMMFLFTAFIELTLLLVVHGGVIYATYVGARSAVVWDTAQPAGKGAEKVHLAVAHALAPFASGNPKHLSREYLDLARQDISYTYCQAYFRYAGEDASVSNNYLVRKLYYARQSLVLYHEPPPAWNSEKSVSVTYDHAFHLPAMGRLLGRPSARVPGLRVFTIRYTARLQNEGAKTPDQQLGIDYDSDY